MAGVIAIALAFGVASASAGVTHVYSGTSFGPGGVGSGSFGTVQGLGVDDATGDVYVYAAGSVYKFNAAGEPAEFTALHANVITSVGESGAAENQLAVDNSASGSAKGDIYVANGEGGFQVRVYNAEGTFLGEVNQAAASPQSGGEPCGVAVDGAGNVYVGYFTGHVDKYTPVDANPEHNIFDTQLESAGEICNVAADGEGSIYTDVWGNGGNTAITKYDALQLGSPTPTGNPFAEGRTVAVDHSNNDVYVDQGGKIIQSDALGNSITKFGKAGVGVLSGSSAVVVNDSLSTPDSGKVYASGGAAGEVEIFGPLVTLPDVITGAGTGAGTGEVLHGTVNPLEIAVTSCEFEYGTSLPYEHNAPCSALPGSGGAPVEVHAEVSGAQLQPLAEYHFRLLAGNASGKAEAQDATFTAPPGLPVVENESVRDVSATAVTLRADVNSEGTPTSYHFEYVTDANFQQSGFAGAALVPQPDAEIGTGAAGVSVEQQVQGLVGGTGYRYRLVASSEIGVAHGQSLSFNTQQGGTEPVLTNGRDYELVSPADKHGTEAIGIGRYSNGGLVQASEDGTKVTYLTVEPPVDDPAGNGNGSQLLSTRGPEAWATSDIAPSNTQPTGASVGAGSEYKMFSPDLSTGFIQKLGGPNEVWALNGRQPESIGQFSREFSGASPDLRHIIITTPVALTPGAVEGLGKPNLYEWSDGAYQAVNVLPSASHAGETAPNADLGANGENVRHAVSDDGSRVVWTDLNGGLFDRENGTTTVQIDASQGGPGAGGTGSFEIASSDGSRVFFTDFTRLTPDATGSDNDLYEFNVNTRILTDLTVDHNPGDPRGAAVAGVVGASEDGSVLYFVAEGVLTGANSEGRTPVANDNNLYVIRNGKLDFVAVGANPANITENLSTRVTPDGEHMVFESLLSATTGYDNRDARTGSPDTELFLYDAAAGHVTCVSCGPTGERPVGSSTIPGGTPYELHHAIYQSRVLTNDGRRLFFESRDALVPQDTNGRQDVYQFSEGHSTLLSTGQSGEDSFFLDASTSGDDVFLLTAQPLVTEDSDHVFDIYDTHACTSTHPCFSQAPVLPPPCSSGDGCRPAPSPQPGVFGPSGTATFAGPENVKAVTPRPKVKARAKQHRRSKKRKAKSRKASGKKSKRPAGSRRRPTKRGN